MSDEPAGWVAEFTEWMAECLARDLREDEPFATINDPRQGGLPLYNNSGGYQWPRN